MQKGFFDELLEKEQSQETQSVENVQNVEDVQSVEEVQEFNFGDFTANAAQTSNVENSQNNSVENVNMNNNTAFEEKSKKEPISEQKQEIKQEEVKQVKQNVEQVKQEAPKNEIVKKDATTSLIENTLNKINEIVSYSNEEFSPRAKIIACDIITNTDHALKERGIIWKEVDTIGSGLIMQVKKWAKLGVDWSNDYLYPDIRKNGKTGKYDIKIKPQYQTVEKLMRLFCSKKITNFITKVICIGDELKTKIDWKTGEEVVEDFIENPKVDRTKMENIIGAFKVVFYENEKGEIHQIVTKIDKDRIMRAYNCATTKNIWNADTRKMVLKTVTWEMFKGENIRPFMCYPNEIIEDLSIVDETSDVDFDKEHKYKSVIEAQESAVESIGTGEKVDFDN